jgi:predicted Zn-dependent protease
MASNKSAIVFPGTENSFNPDLPSYRSGLEYDNRMMSAALTDLVERQKQGTATRDDLFWLATGFLTTGQLTPARKYVDIARAEHPADTELAVLDALVFLLDDNPKEAERILRDKHRSDPDNAVAQVNLSAVLLELGKNDEARTILHEISTRYPDTRLARRARALLSDI